MLKRIYQRRDMDFQDGVLPSRPFLALTECPDILFDALYVLFKLDKLDQVGEKWGEENFIEEDQFLVFLANRDSVVELLDLPDLCIGMDEEKHFDAAVRVAARPLTFPAVSFEHAEPNFLSLPFESLVFRYAHSFVWLKPAIEKI